MKHILIGLLFVAHLFQAQEISVGMGKTIYITKEYILENKIKSITFDEFWGYKKGKPNQNARYTVYFDSTGIPKEALVTDVTRPGKHQELIQLQDSIDPLKYDTVRYDSHQNIIKTTYYSYQNYYSYDQLARLVYSKSYTPQIGEYIYSSTLIKYDEKGRIYETIYKDGRSKVPLQDSVIRIESITKIIYKGNRTENINDTTIELQNERDTSYYKYEYVEGKLTRIMQEHSDQDLEYFYINVTENQ